MWVFKTILVYITHKRNESQTLHVKSVGPPPDMDCASTMSWRYLDQLRNYNRKYTIATMLSILLFPWPIMSPGISLCSAVAGVDMELVFISFGLDKNQTEF